ncbi:hypothetical protein JOF56_003831 [Kibdelosporangium banguiense]|uniref:LTD domain-containing protein n=1 Tax=Kibdelosporangium banguiense TaxID=1365924 RepID=A0ABS4TG98_9PSEU|nr:hypothetical protein [Kibdelosporangium banguiense]MBP2323446.1 hypothetical protein [Kibdelosporangium banguiense]
MKRTIPAVLATGMMILGLTGTANASEPQNEASAVKIVPGDVYISEVATRLGGLPNQEFIEICNRSADVYTVPMGGLQAQASFGAADPRRLVAEIPADTMIHPGQAYVLASPSYILSIPDQTFDTARDIPDQTVIRLVKQATNVTMDSVATTPATPHLTRVNFTGINAWDFVRKEATPSTCNP